VSGNRFFVPLDVFNQAETFFPPAISKQITSVLRLKSGQMVTILDNNGHCRSVELLDIDSKQVTGLPGEISPATGEPKVNLTLCVALSQREKFEWILQKGCELGVRHFIPVVTSRSLVQDTRGREEKMDRWNKILQEASEQCGRGLIPSINNPQKLDDFLKQNQGRRGYILHEKVKGSYFAASLQNSLISGEKDWLLLVGPEGGFSEDEVNLAEQAGLQPVSLGPRILRMETAVLAACAVFMAAAGELGSMDL